ncbi:MAG: glucose-6-phosphate dehydrogenase assembly protein OpcA [Roseiflexus sp.]
MTDIFTTPSMRLTQVDAGAIECELSRLWSAAMETKQADGVALMRACVFNLVVLTDAAKVASVTNIVARLTALRPHRAIVAALDGDEGAHKPQPRLEAWVQAHCTLALPGRPQICGEQITIIAPCAAGPYIPGIVLSLLEPDVPVILWWTLDRLPDKTLLAHLQPVADRLILDTARMPEGVDALYAVRALIDAGLAVGDFVWGRLTPWREQIAQLFDAPPTLQRLQAIEHVTISHAPRGATAALLLAGWIVARLDWRLSAVYDTSAMLSRPDGGSVLIEQLEVAIETADDLVSVALETTDARFTVTRSTTGDYLAACAMIDDLMPVERAVHLPALDAATLIADELRLTRHDPIYEAALRQALNLVKSEPTPAPERPSQ